MELEAGARDLASHLLRQVSQTLRTAEEYLEALNRIRFGFM